MCATPLDLVTPTPSSRTVLVLLAFALQSTSFMERTLLLLISLQALMSAARQALSVRQHLQLLQLVHHPRHRQLLPPSHLQLLPRLLRVTHLRQPQHLPDLRHNQPLMDSQHLQHPPHLVELLRLGSRSASGDPALSTSGALGGSVTT
jgi:hypothetical protein